MILTPFSWKLLMLLFRPLFEANNCDIDRLKSEFRILINHIVHSHNKTSPPKVWPQIFRIKENLNVVNVLHIVELSIAVPLSNAECERFFSYLWRTLSKDRLSLSRETQENLLRVRGDTNFEAEKYNHAVDLFLTVYPDGTTRKRARHLDGHLYPKKRKSSGKKQHSLHEISDVLDNALLDINNISIADISDEEWASSDSEDY